jgi:hypothetical protein
MNILSFSLYGSTPRYATGVLLNAELAPVIYPGWEMRIYHGVEVDPKLLAKLAAKGCTLVPSSHWHFGPPQPDEPPLPHGYPRFPSARGMFWRFLAAEDPADYVIFRDVDARLNVREQVAVEAWIASGKPYHGMHDSRCHVRPIMGGMWGVKGGSLPMRSLMEDWPFNSRYGDDQDFLERKVWPLVQAEMLIHGPRGLPFPPHGPCTEFVGQSR